jgi:hypothetical protein
MRRGAGGRAQDRASATNRRDLISITGTVAGLPQSGMVSRKAAAAGWADDIGTGGRAGRRTTEKGGAPTRLYPQQEPGHAMP